MGSAQPVATQEVIPTITLMRKPETVADFMFEKLRAYCLRRCGTTLPRKAFYDDPVASSLVDASGLKTASMSIMFMSSWIAAIRSPRASSCGP